MVVVERGWSAEVMWLSTADKMCSSWSAEGRLLASCEVEEEERRRMMGEGEEEEDGEEEEGKGVEEECEGVRKEYSQLVDAVLTCCGEGSASAGDKVREI